MRNTTALDSPNPVAISVTPTGRGGAWARKVSTSAVRVTPVTVAALEPGAG